MKQISIFILFSLVLIYSCKSPKKEDIIGVWISNDSSRFQFYNDCTFNVENMPKSILFGHYTSKNLYSGSGVWSIQCLENIWKIELIFPKSNELPGGFACNLNIEKKFHFGKSTWSLFFYGENFDYKYEFKPVNLIRSSIKKR
jgi:hypothetical protein